MPTNYRMNGMTGEVAILADAYPLDPHVTLRLALENDPLCACGDRAVFVLLEADKANRVPRRPDLADRSCTAWVHIHESVCSNHVAIAVRDAGKILSV